ncbi:gamma-aminobutyric acid receptor subunit alpha-1-like isoform X2 [Montipora foliosa]|uniref:gamma-aminobutyric acid receptor subunit alpha-1-like isoform X2 n=1 Tax=Montipora foliosa TaxID=591990 RepID=UPI0035F1F744
MLIFRFLLVCTARMTMEPAGFRLFLLLCCYEVIYCDREVITMFFKDYDSTTYPNFEGTPTKIRSSIYIESFGNFEEANMEYKVHGYFRQYWTDLRLAGKSNRTQVLRGRDISKIWKPDPYCYNARESNLMIPDEELYSSVKISPSGDMVMSIGAVILASCVMNLEDYPLDSQTCHLEFGSYAYTADQIMYEWIPEKIGVESKEMAQFEYKGFKLSSGVSVYAVGNYSTITVTFSFQRRLGYFLIQIYLPDMFLVMLSWIAFWMKKDDIGNRMALGITTILTIMFLLGSLNGNLPQVSYAKTLDWYLLVSFSFVFLSLIESTTVYILIKKATKKDGNISRKIPKSKSLSGSETNDRSSKKPNGHAYMGNGEDLEMGLKDIKVDKISLDSCEIQENTKNKRMKKMANLIDSISRVLFPLTFACYNIFYWTHY